MIWDCWPECSVLSTLTRSPSRPIPAYHPRHGDAFEAAAAITEFKHVGLAASHPLAINGGADPFLSPYTLIVGATARLLHISPLTIFSIAAVVNVVLLFAALYWFATSFIRSSSAGFVLVMATLLLWGWDPWQWAGYFNLNGIGMVGALGSTFASATGIVALGSVNRWLRLDGHLGNVATAAILLPVTLLVHPMTALWVGVIAIGLWLTPGTTWRKRLTLAGPIAVGMAATLAWPYYWVPDLLWGSQAVGPTNLGVFRRVPLRSFLATPAFVVMYLRRCDRELWPLMAGFVAVLAVFLVGWGTSNGLFGRTFPGVMLCAHTLIAAQVIRMFESREVAFDSLRRVVGLLVVLGVLAVGSVRGVFYMTPYSLMPPSVRAHVNDNDIDRYVEAMPGPIHRDDVIAASADIALGVGALSAKAIRPPMRPPLWPEAEIGRRDRLQARLFRSEVPWAERRREFRDEGVDWLVLNDWDLQMMAPPPSAVIRTASPGITIVQVSG